MKKEFLIYFILSIFWQVNSQGTWNTFSDFPGTPRAAASGFAINNKIYLLGGNHWAPDFWEYDTDSGIWTQKNDFPGGARWYATAFVVQGKAYIGFNDFGNDFWEYDPITDVWTQKNNFPGISRFSAVSFAIGNKGYLGTGQSYSPFVLLKDFWEYNPSNDSWVQLSDFPGTARCDAAAFVIGNKAFIGVGQTGLYPSPFNCTNDFYEFDALTQSWTQKQNFPVILTRPVAFSLGAKGYLGMGVTLSPNFYYPPTMWKYSPSTNQWDTIMPMPVLYGCSLPVTATVNNVAYVITGCSPGNKVFGYRPGSDLATSTQQSETGVGKIYVDETARLNIVLSNKDNFGRFKLYDLNGSLIKEFDVSAGQKVYRSEPLDIAKGLYFLSLPHCSAHVKLVF